MVRLGRVQRRQATWQEAKAKRQALGKISFGPKITLREVEIERGLRERERQTRVMR